MTKGAKTAEPTMNFIAVDPGWGGAFAILGECLSSSSQRPTGDR